MAARRLNVKLLRERMGLTQEAFAEEVGVGWRSISRWEQGHFNPSRLALDRLQQLQQRLAEQTREAKRDAAPGPRRVALAPPAASSRPSESAPVTSSSGAVVPWRIR